MQVIVKATEPELEHAPNAADDGRFSAGSAAEEGSWFAGNYTK